MKVYILWDERYPDPNVYPDRLGRESEIEIPEEEYADWVRVLKEYNSWCEKWAKLEDAAS